MEFLVCVLFFFRNGARAPIPPLMGEEKKAAQEAIGGTMPHDGYPVKGVERFGF